MSLTECVRGRAREVWPHRADIDGLRGIAVLSVLAVHAFPQQISGGFVGVDVFFVLSGFLIASIVRQSIAQGEFSVLDFYARRVRRILPALCTVLLACAIFGALLLFPSDLRRMGKHIAAGAFFSSNIALWLEAGYFDAASEVKPLLHLWSLGIEEQFYLFWPLTALWLARRPRLALAWIAVGLVLSFSLNVALVHSKPVATFFLLPTRAWELLVGVALAYWRWRPSTNLSRNALATLGAVLLALALSRIDKNDPFPGWWALLPTLGTAALLTAGSAAWFNHHVLSHRVLVYYGEISYALYLWHWPLLVFPVLMGIDMSAALRVLILTVGVALAALTTEYIEQPIRNGHWGRHRPRQALALCAALAGVGLAGAGLRHLDGLINTYPLAMREIAAAEFGFDFGAYRAARCFLDLQQGPAAFAAECWPTHRTGERSIMLWGDSHAASLYPGLVAVSVAGGRRAVVEQFTKARCPAVMAPPAGASHQCGETNAFVMARVAARPPHTVVIGGYWSHYDSVLGDGAWLQALRDTVAQLKVHGVERVVVVGHLPTWTMPLPRLLLQEWRDSRAVPERSNAHLAPGAAAMDTLLRAALVDTGAEFFAPMQTLCNANGCLVSQTRAGSAFPMAHDESHLTELGSVALVQGAASGLLR